MRRLSGLLLCALLAASPACAAERVYNAQTAMLDNGMQVVVIPVHRTPAVTHMVWYRVGAADEPQGVSGTAHFLEHLMFKGTPNYPAGKFSEAVQRMGGNENAFTSWDYTAFFQSVPKEKLGDVMRMESERMNDLTPKISDVYSERQVVIEERRQNTDSDPASLLAERMRFTLFPNHNYGRPIIGWMPEMQHLTWVDSLAFYKKWYAPNNAILVVSGDTTLDQVLPLARATYGKLPRESVPMRTRTTSPHLDGDVRVTFARADVRQPQWMYMLRAPSARENAKDTLALQVLEDVLGGATGVLYRELTVKEKIATDIDVSYDPNAWDDATLTFYATPATGVSPEKLEAAVRRVLEATAAKGFAPDDIKKSLTRLTDAAVYARDSLAGPAMTVGAALVAGDTLDNVETWPARLASVTPADVTAALKTVVLAQNGVNGWLLPAKPDKPEGKKP